MITLVDTELSKEEFLDNLSTNRQLLECKGIIVTCGNGNVSEYVSEFCKEKDINHINLQREPKKTTGIYSTVFRKEDDLKPKANIRMQRGIKP